MPDRHERIAISVALAAIVAIPGVAAADCPSEPSAVEAILPAHGSAGHPTNGVIAFGTSPAYSVYDPIVTLTKDGEGAVSGALLAGPAGTWIFRPDDPLEPGAAYTAQVVDSAGIGEVATTAFSTGAAGDLTDPAVGGPPTIEQLDYVPPVEEDDCLRAGYFPLAVDWPDTEDASQVIYALSVQVEDLVPEFAPATAEAAPHSLSFVASQGTIAVPERSEVTVVVWAIDGAGRQGHSVATTVEVPAAPSGRGGGEASACHVTGRSHRHGAGGPHRSGTGTRAGVLALAVAVAGGILLGRRAC